MKSLSVNGSLPSCIHFIICYSTSQIMTLGVMNWLIFFWFGILIHSEFITESNLDGVLMGNRAFAVVFAAMFSCTQRSMASRLITKEREFNNIRILTGLIVRLLRCSNSCVALLCACCYALKTNNNPASIFRILLKPRT